MKEKIRKHIKKYEVLYSALVLLVCCSGLVASLHKFQVIDEIFTFTNIYKLHNGVQLYSQNNVIHTPLFFYLGNAFLSIFGVNFFGYKLFAIVILEITCILILNILRKLNIPTLRALIYIILIIIPMERDIFQAGANYNILAILFWILGMNLIIRKNKNQKEYKFKVNPVYQGIISALIFATKQNIGIFYLIGLTAFTIYNYRNNIKTIMKKLFATYGIFLGVTVIWVIGLALQGQFKDFINYCFLGLGEFASHHTRVSIDNIVFYAIPFIALIGLIIAKKKFKLSLESKFVKTTIFFLCFMFASLLIGYPIFNKFHILIALLVSFIYCAYIMEQIVSRLLDLLNNAVVKSIVIICVLIIMGTSIFYIGQYAIDLLNKDYKLTYDNPFFGTVLEEGLKNNIKEVVNFVENKKANNQQVIIFATEADFYQIALKGNNQDFDLPLLGNWGYKGEERVLNKIKNLENTYILMKNTDFLGQESQKLKDFIKNNYNKTGEIAGFTIYFVR